MWPPTSQAIELIEQKTIDGTRPLECIEPYCRETVVAFDTHHMTLYCRKHLKEDVLSKVKYSNNIHVEFFPDKAVEE